MTEEPVSMVVCVECGVRMRSTEYFNHVALVHPYVPYDKLVVPETVKPTTDGEEDGD